MDLLSSVLLSGGSMIDLDGTFFVQLVLFFVAFGVLHGLVFRPMIALFEAREEAIDGAKATASKLSAEAAGADKSFDARLRDVRTKAGLERDRLKAEGRDIERSLLETVRGEIEASTSANERELTTRATELRGDLTRSVPSLANQIASKLLEREVK
jgi:F-type H+-transporting ATPase subunit b